LAVESSYPSGAGITGLTGGVTGNGNAPGALLDSNSSVSLVPSEASPQSVGERITWTATATDVGDNPVYQFSVGAHGGSLQMVRDFSHDNTFTWAPMQEGTYDVAVVVKEDFGAPVATSAVVSDTVNPLTQTVPVVTPTANPLVALYSAPPCSEGAMHVDFRPVGAPAGPWTSTDSKPCIPGETTNFLVAGMLPNTTYEMVNVTSQGSSAPRFFTTGALPASLVFPTFTVRQAPGAGSDLSQNMIFHSTFFGGGPNVNTLATDLMGRVEWYYDPLASGIGGGTGMSLVPGGTVLLMDSVYGTVLREVDLAGNTLRETNVDAINAQLTARGDDTILDIHHDAQRLPNGATAVLAQIQRTVDIDGTPRQYQGDMVIVLDENFQVAWTWNAFDFLDVHRAPVGEPTATDPVDWLHSNAVAWSPTDGNLVVSIRNQDWVIKIAYENGTGDGHVIWRLGQDGDFTIDSADPYPWFSHQHNAHFIDDQTMVLFDNGNTRRLEFPGSNSRGQVLTIDEHAHTVTPVLTADLGNYSLAVGSAQKLPNGNYVFTSGFQGLPPAFGQSIEVRPDGTPAYVLEVASLEYRSYRVSGLYGTRVNEATTSVNSSANPSGLGLPVTFTATVSPTAPGPGMPTGTVSFQEGTTVLGTAQLNSAGVATFTTSALSVGTHAIVATYNGDVSFGTSTSTPLSQTVGRASTTTTLSSAPNPSSLNQPVMFTATITPSSAGAFTPGGTVTFFDGGTPLGAPVSVAGGTATFAISALTPGTHPITATYSGDANFAGSTSAVDNQAVSQTATTALLISSPSPSTVNQPVAYTVAVAPASGTGVPTGTVTFLSDGAALGTAPLINGTATLRSSGLPAGTHVITATYGGDATFAASTAAPRNQVVSPAATSLTLTGLVNPVRSGRAAKFTATVATSAAGTSFAPGGTVTFFDGATPLGQPVRLSNGAATFTTSALTPGVHSIVARYAGDNNFAASTSSALSQVVRAGKFFALGGASNRVQVRRTSDGSLVVEFAPFAASYTAGVTVALGDVNGDGFEDLIVGSASGAPHVKVYDGKALANGTFTAANAESHLITQFMAYDPKFGVGVNVAAAYVKGTPNADIITGPTFGNPHVKVYDSDALANGTFSAAHPDASLLAQWFAYSVNFNIGVTVAGGDVEGDGFADVVTGAASGNPHVKVYSGRAIHNHTLNGLNPDSSLVTSFMPYATGSGLGVNVAVGDVNGDGFADVITGPTRSSPQVRVFNGRAMANGTFAASHPDASRLDQFFAFDPKFGTGVALAASDFTGSGRASILTGAMSGSPHYRLVDGLNSTGILPPALQGIDAVLANFRGGLFVAA
jgi:hypothetical protein